MYKTELHKNKELIIKRLERANIDCNELLDYWDIEFEKISDDKIDDNIKKVQEIYMQIMDFSIKLELMIAELEEIEFPECINHAFDKKIPKKSNLITLDLYRDEIIYVPADAKLSIVFHNDKPKLEIVKEDADKHDDEKT